MRITYNAVPPAKKTVDFITNFYFDNGSFRSIGLYYKYLEWVFRYIQTEANDSFGQQVDANFKSILAIFLVFMGLILILAIGVLTKLVFYLKARLLKIKLAFKVIPSAEIFRNKEHLEKLNTHML